MVNSPRRSPDRAQATRAGEKQAGKITPELVQQIADKVYAMWLMDLKVERERRRPLAGGPLNARGGW